MVVVLIVILTYLVLLTRGQTNNVCPTYEDYYTISSNPKCWYDFAVESNMTQLVMRHGFPVEVHRLVTPDGYILTVFRIPNYQSAVAKKTPVFLQHGLASTSANWMAIGNNSLAILLAEAGYDVWLGNFRGTEYSEGHVNLTVANKEYWDHSMDELGLYDIPLQVELVAQKTGQRGNIIYIGHSLGTTLGMIYTSSYPDLARKTLKMMFLLAPAATLSNMISPLKFLAPFAEIILRLVEKNDLIRIASQAEPQRREITPVCLESPLLMKRCIDLANIFYGPKGRMGAESVPVYFNQLPGGTSLRVTRHAADLILNNFRRYNYGLRNIKTYASIFPPTYDVSRIEVPTHIMYSIGDWVCSKKDSQILYSRLSPNARYGIDEVSDPNFNHNDFLFGRGVKTLVYDRIMSIINTINEF